MAWTSEDEKLLAELAGEVTTERSGSERSEVPRFGSKTSSNSATSRRSSLKSLDSVTSLLEKLDRPQGERGKAQRKTSKEVEALPEVSGLKEGLQTEASEASLRSRQVEQVLSATTKPDHDKEEEAQRELAAERASSEKAQQELSRLREELQTEASEASLRSRQVEQLRQEVSCLQEELQTAETSLHRQQAELMAASREQVLLATPKSEDSKEEAPKSLWARFRRDVSPTRVKDSQKAQRELGRLKEQLRTAEAELQEASKREQAQQELNRLTVELQTTEAGLYKAALKREQDAQRELSAERVAFQEARQELSRLREQLQVAEEQLRQEPPVADPLDPLDRRDEGGQRAMDGQDAHRELAAEYETFQQAQQELFHLGAELQRAEAGLWHQRAELEEEMQKMQSDRPAKQLQTSPSNKQKLHGQHEELRQLRLLQEEVRKQEEVAKSQEAQRSFWQERREEQDREIEKFRSELQSLKAEKARSRNGADGAVGLEEQLESERKRESVEQVNIQSFEDQRSQQFAEKDGDEDELSSKEFSTMACLSRFKGQLAAKGVSDLDALTKIFAAYDTQKEQESITQIGFVCAMQQGGFLLSKSEVDGMFTHLAGELHGQVWRLPYEYLQSCMDDVSCPLPEVQWATGLIRSADEAARLQGKSLEMLFGQLEMESVSQLDVQAILSRYIKVGSEWRKLLPLIDKNPDGTVPWKSMLTWAGLGRQSPCPEASAPPSAADREAVQSGREVLAMQITIRELRGEVEAQERCMEELQELQQQIQGMSAAEAHQELRMHSRLAQFEMNQLQEMQEVKHHLHEELAERERQNRVDLARHAELQKDSKSREETLESTAAELEKELKFWQRRSDEDLEELLQLQSEMKSLKDAEEFSGEEEHLKVQLQQSEMRCKMQREEAEEWKEESRRFEKELLHQRSSCVQGGQELQQEFLMERRKLLEKVAQGESGQEQAFQAERLRAIRAEERCQVQETLHQAELARLTARYEKALLRCSSEQARLLSRYEKEKEEWAADWKEVNDIMQPLIQTHEAAEVQRVTRQAAAQEGLNLLKQFAQLKELETQELKRGRQASEVMAVRLDAERTESRAESGAESAEDHQEQTCEGAELRGPGNVESSRCGEVPMVLKTHRGLRLLRHAALTAMGVLLTMILAAELAFRLGPDPEFFA